MSRRVRSAVLGFLAAGAMAVAGVAVTQEPAADDGSFAMGNQGRMVRGTVTTLAGDHLTLKTEAGETYQVVVTTNTRMMKDRQPVKLADVHTGDGVGAMGVVDAPAKTIHAAMMFVVDAAQVKKLKEDMGKTYISGKVTAIDEVQLTVHRSDGVDQKITVDEGTSFKKGAPRWELSSEPTDGGTRQSAGGASAGESITLADVKVGDMVGGPGVLKAGVFVPTQLMVMDAASMARRRHAGGNNAAPGGDAAGANPH